MVAAVGVVTIVIAVLLGLSLMVQVASGAAMYVSMRAMQAKRKAVSG